MVSTVRLGGTCGGPTGGVVTVSVALGLLRSALLTASMASLRERDVHTNTQAYIYIYFNIGYILYK